MVTEPLGRKMTNVGGAAMAISNRRNAFLDSMIAFDAVALAIVLSAAWVGAQPLAYVANSTTNDVSVIDTSAFQVVGRFCVGRQPIGVAASPVRDFVYVTNSVFDTVSVVDTNGPEVIVDVPVA